MNAQHFDLTQELLPLEKMANIVNQNAKSYQAATPFPHIVIDDFFNPGDLEAILAEFPTNKEQINWKTYNKPHEIKFASRSERDIGPFTRYFLYTLNAETFLKFLEQLTGIEGLIPDPHFEGGGLHMIRPGGKLGVHVDFNRHKHLKLDRRINLLLYLNKNWQDKYNGHLELWDKDMTTCAQRIAPLFNRVVIFNTTDFSYHGHPDILQCPEGMQRQSLALYYYTNGRPQHEISDKHNTLFKLRPGEQSPEATKKLSISGKLKRFLGKQSA